MSVPVVARAADVPCPFCETPRAEFGMFAQPSQGLLRTAATVRATLGTLQVLRGLRTSLGKQPKKNKQAAQYAQATGVRTASPLFELEPPLEYGGGRRTTRPGPVEGGDGRWAPLLTSGDSGRCGKRRRTCSWSMFGLDFMHNGLEGIGKAIIHMVLERTLFTTAGAIRGSQQVRQIASRA
jgi:hypothetical protein